MFFPKAMSELELIVPAGDLVNVAKVLGGKGIFHQVEAGSIGSKDHQRQDSWGKSAAAYAALERRIQTLIQNLAIDGPPVQPTEIGDPVDLEQARGQVDGIEQEFRAVGDRMARAAKTAETLKAHKQQLSAIADIDLDVTTIKDSRYLLSILGTIPVANVGRLQTSLARVPHVFLTLREDSHRPVVWIGGTVSNRDVFERATRSAYLEPLVLPEGYHGSPSDVIKGIDVEIAAGERELEALRAALRSLAERHTAALSRLAWNVHASRALAEAVLKFGRLRHTYIIVGWAPTQSMNDLLTRIRSTSKETIIETTRADRAGDRRNVPVALQTSRTPAAIPDACYHVRPTEVRGGGSHMAHRPHIPPAIRGDVW